MNNPLEHYGDKKYYRSIHVRKQKEMGYEPLSYIGFLKRLYNGLSLHDAIYFKRGHPSNVKPVKFDIESKSRLNANLLEEGVNVHDYEKEKRIIVEEKRMDGKKITTNRFLKLMKEVLKIGK